VGAESAGTTQVYPGSATGMLGTPLATLVGTVSSGFGHSVSGTGDINGDGFADVVVGAWQANRAFVYLGGAAGTSTMAAATLSGPSGNFGVSVSDGGDVNGDGYADVAVGAYNASTVSVYLGGRSGLAVTPTVITGTHGTGVSVSLGGDLNGDGLGDLVAGTFNSQVEVVLGATGGLATTPTPVNDPTGVSASSFGVAAVLLGDVNRDGFGDLAAGAVEANRVPVFLGTMTGVSGTPAQTLSGPAGTRFGISVASRGVPQAPGPRRGTRILRESPAPRG